MAEAQLGTVLRHIRRLVVPANTRDLADRQLLQCFTARRDQAAFAELVRRHGALVLGLCRRLLGHAQDAEDAFQATFLVLARNAAGVRNGDKLVSWLYGVAYRTAMKAKRDAARRRGHERQAANRPPDKAAGELALRELQAVLDEEVHRLPEKYRTPFVLCCVEGKSKPEVAQELGWKEGTVSSRLVRARQQLQQRLARRGVTLSAALSAAALGQAGAAVALPAALVNSTVKAALLFAAGRAEDGAIAAPVAALAQGVSRTMALNKLRIATVLLLAAGLGAVGLLSRRALADKPAPAKAEAPKAPAKAAPPAAPAGADKTKGSVTVNGQVLDPDGKPVAGAKLYLLTYPTQSTALKVRATSAADGRFGFTFTREQVDLPYGYLDPWVHVLVLAAAEGFGPALSVNRKVDAPGDMKLQLARDDVPVNGRVLDLQGKPVAGVTVRLTDLLLPTDLDLSPWLEALQAAKDSYPAQNKFLKGTHSPALAALFPAVTTDTAGKFQLKGIGRERVVGLTIEGPTIETREVQVRTRPGPALARLAWKDNPEGDRLTVYGATFEHAAAPTKPVVGTVRDKDTGKPLAGVTVQSEKVASSNMHGRGFIKTTTDKEGRYRLTGLPKGEGNLIKAVPPNGQPYLMSVKEVRDTPNLEPVTVDFPLKRGVLLKGRVTDKATGQPAPAQVEYFIFGDNPHRKEAPGLSTERWLYVRADGSFELAALPGRGLLAVRGQGDRYLVAVGADRIKGQDERGMYPTYPYLCLAKGYHTLVEINPEPGTATMTCEVALDPGRTITGTVLDPDGKPLAGAFMCGMKAYAYTYWDHKPLPGAEFTAYGIQPGKPRRLLFVHQDKRLAGELLVRGDEQGPLTVKLGPWGTLTGRLLTRDGAPIARGDLRFLIGDNRDDVNVGTHPTRSFTTDKDGKFRIEGLVPGLKYHLTAMDGFKVLNELAKGVTVKAGETKDLGDVALKGGE
jgi:RNA polymerase sigma factor (sigma-70 family)